MEKFIIVFDEAHKVMASVSEALPLIYPHDGRFDVVGYDLDQALGKIPDLYFFIGECIHPSVGLESTPEDKLRRARGRKFPDITKIDRRCQSTSRLKIAAVSSSMLSAEVLLFGVGALRRCWDSPDDTLHTVMRKRVGLLFCDGMLTQKIPTTYFASQFRQTLPESWESTNLIYGDAYGELRQLLRRSGERQLMEGVLAMLNAMFVKFESAFIARPRRSTESDLVRGHYFANHKWASPPASRAELIERLCFILSHCNLDTNPRTVYSQTSQE